MTFRSQRTSHLSTAVLSALALSACADRADRSALTEPDTDSRPSLAIVDARSGGRAGFYFAAPLIPGGAVISGPFDDGLLSQVVVAICPANAAGTCTGATVRYTSQTKPAVTLDPVAQQYALNWSAKTGSYRVRVLVGATELGLADVVRLSNGSYQTVVPPNVVTTVKTATLPIRFRIEQGVVASVVVTPVAPNLPPFNLSLQAPAPRYVTATVTDLRGQVITSPVVTWVSSAPAVATVTGSVVNGVARGTLASLTDGEVTFTATSGGVSATSPVYLSVGDLSAILGESTIDLPRTDICGNFQGRLCESLVGNVVTDAMRAATNAEFAITNVGGIRASLTCGTDQGLFAFCPNPLPPGNRVISRAQALSVLPFGWRMATVVMSGAEFKAQLENGVAFVTTNTGRFAQVSGFCMRYDISLAVGSRITGVVRQAADGTCTGAAVDLTAGSTYTVVMNDFMTAGGDSYTNFGSRAQVGTTLDFALVAYVRAKQVLSPTFQGRIQCEGTGCPVPVVQP